MAPYTYNWSRCHFQALPIINPKLFNASQKEHDTQKVARVNGSGKAKGKKEIWNDNRKKIQILAYAHEPN